ADVSDEGLGAWLSSRPAMGVVIIGHGPIRLYTGSPDHSIACTDVIDVEGEVLDSFSAAAANFGKCLSAFQFGRVDDNNLHDEPDIHGAFDDALANLLDAARPLARPLYEATLHKEVSELAVVCRTGLGYFPWESIPIDVHGRKLGDVLRIVRLDTLGDHGGPRVKKKDTVLAYVGTHEQAGKELTPGKYALSLSSAVQSGYRREAFEEAAMNAGVIRLFSHAQHTPGPSSNRIHLGTSENSYRLAETGEAFPWYTSGEIKALDLRGCARVELWACESAHSHDMFGFTTHVDEPNGLASAFLMTGAQRVLGSWWKQPIAPAALICAHFSSHAGETQDAFADAATLAGATAAYREAVAPGGVFEIALRRSVEANISGATDPDELRRSALADAWRAAFEAMTGRPSPDDAVDIAGAFLGGFASKSVEAQRLEQIGDDLDDTIAKWMALWQGPAAWAGWRIVARDRRSLVAE
ncbi:MAG: CHAT domain-containing protein, partial [Bradymonadaceae bacterium]